MRQKNSLNSIRGYEMGSFSESYLGRWHKRSGPEEHNQLFVIGDVHGQAQALAAALDAVAAIPRAANRRRLVFLGDLIDRGPHSLDAIKLAMTAADRTGADDLVLLPGNHELMLLDALEHPMKFMGDWLDNGGETLIAEARRETPIRLLNDFASVASHIISPDFLAAMQDAPSHVLSGNLLLVHAGLAPSEDADAFLRVSGRAAHGCHWAWIRRPFLDWRGGWGPDGDWQVVHGHTPAVTRPSAPDRFFAAANRLRTHQRICLDAGSAFGLAQVGWAEFTAERFRLALSRG